MVDPRTVDAGGGAVDRYHDGLERGQSQHAGEVQVGALYHLAREETRTLPTFMYHPCRKETS